MTITGANGYSVTGQAVLDYAQTYPYTYQLASNRDQLTYNGDYQITPHLAALIGFHYEDERGLENVPTYAAHETAERTNYDYLAAVHGDFKNRFFYTLGGSLDTIRSLGPRPRHARASPTTCPPAQRHLHRHAHAFQLRRRSARTGPD